MQVEWVVRERRPGPPGCAHVPQAGSRPKRFGTERSGLPPLLRSTRRPWPSLERVRGVHSWLRSRIGLHKRLGEPMSNAPQHDDWLETYKSLITLSTEGFKFCALANGGAAVAILAYLGNVVGKGFAAPDMSCPMAFFLAGLVLCGATMLFAYLTQLSCLNRISQRKDPSKDWRLWVAIALFVCSLAAFAIGSWKAVVAFRNFASDTPVVRTSSTAMPVGIPSGSAASAPAHR